VRMTRYHYMVDIIIVLLKVNCGPLYADSRTVASSEHVCCSCARYMYAEANGVHVYGYQQQPAIGLHTAGQISNVNRPRWVCATCREVLHARLACTAHADAGAALNTDN
jgi:hypothetical protein